VKRRLIVPLVLFGLMAGAGIAVHRTSSEDRVDLSAPLELWADALRDTGALTRKPLDQELRLGARLAATVPVDPPADPALQAYVERVGKRLVAQAARKEISYRFTVREDAAVNAFAIPGGYVYVNTELLTFVQSEDELAIVLGHEIAHIELRHATPSVARRVLSLGYTKYQEFDADEAGVRLVARAGYNPHAAIGIFQRLAAQHPAAPRTESNTPLAEAGHVLMGTLGAYWQSHPDPEARVRRISHTIGKSHR
jgi:predicted Zn-dependent protease